MKQLPLSFFAFVIAMATNTSSFGQSREFRYFVRIPVGSYVHVSTPTQETVVRTLPTGTVVKTRSTTITTLDDHLSSITDTISPPVTLQSVTNIKTVKPSTKDLVFTTTEKRRANVVQSKDTLYLNYQLFPNHDSTDRNGLSMLFCKPKPSVRAKPWLPVAELPNSCEFPAPGFNRKNRYFIKLNDRQAKHFASRSVELAALTVPFQYRPGYSVGNKQVYGQLNTNVSLAVFLGVKLGGVTYRYRKLEALPPNRFTFSVGPFLGLTRVTLDSTNTRLATDKHNLYRNIASLSSGLAAIVDFDDFRIGVFGGRDFAIGSEQWDFNRRYWVGIGVGYKLAVFLAQ